MNASELLKQFADIETCPVGEQCIPGFVSGAYWGWGMARTRIANILRDDPLTSSEAECLALATKIVQKHGGKGEGGHLVDRLIFLDAKLTAAEEQLKITPPKGPQPIPGCPKCGQPRELDSQANTSYKCGTWLLEDGEPMQSGECKVRVNTSDIREETQKWINGFYSAGGLSSQDFARRILAISSRE